MFGITSLAKYILSIVLLLTLLILNSACNPTKTLTSDQYLVNRNTIKIRAKNIDRDELKAIVKQKTNKKLFLGVFRFYLQGYIYANSGTDNRIKRWVNKTIAEEPVILDTTQTTRTSRQLKLFVQKKGYFDAEVNDTTIYDKQKANIFYTINVKKPYRFNQINYSVSDVALNSIVINDTIKSLIKTGDLFDENKIEIERDRITKSIRNKGYYKFNKEFIKLIADSSVKTKLVNATFVISNPTNTTDSVHQKYSLGSVFIYPKYEFTKRDQLFKDSLNTVDGYVFRYNSNLKFKKDVLLKPIFFEPNKLFSQFDVEETYKRYQNLRVFSNVNIEFLEQADSTKRKIDAYIKLSPVRKQSFGIEAEGNISSGYFGIRGNVIYQNKNLFKGAEVLQIKTGLELKQLPNIVIKESSTTVDKIGNFFNTREIGPEMSLTIPRFSFPFINTLFSKRAYPKTIISIAYNYQKNNNYTRSIANASLVYSWRESKFKQHFITPIDFNYVGIIKSAEFESLLISANRPLLTQSYKNLLITAFKYAFVYNTQEEFKKAHTIYFKISGETAGNIPTLINSARGAEKAENDDGSHSYRIFRGVPRLKELEQPYAQYAKLEIDFRHYFNFTESRTLVLRVDGGIAKAYDNSSALPFVKSFIAGGSNDIRAWRARTLGPGNFNDATATVIEKIGDIKFVSNVEYRYNVYKKLNAATFIDIGNIWLINSDNFTGKQGAQFQYSSLYNALAVGGGFGFRYDFSFFILRLDVAARLRDPARLLGNRWVIFDKDFLNINNFNFLNFGIGYPF